MTIPFLSFEGLHKPIQKELITQFKKVLDSNWYILGENLQTFEEEYANWNGVNYCIGVSNGLDALTLSLRALDIGKGDEVIVPSNTYIATVLAITAVGATPIFVEPKLETANINPSNIQSKITKRTKVIMPVHMYGRSCEMDRIMKIAKENDLYVVEDNAQAHGAELKGIKTGSWGTINATSFYPGKNLGALGDGGAITTNDRKLADKVRALRNYGSNKKYHNELIGYNNRLDELQAAFLKIKLKNLDKWSSERQQIGLEYHNSIKDNPFLEKLELAPIESNVFHLFVLKTKFRDKLIKYLNEKGIGTLIHYPIPPHMQECYKNLGFKAGDFPIAEYLSKTVLSIPLYIGMKAEEIKYVIKVLNKFNPIK